MAALPLARGIRAYYINYSDPVQMQTVITHTLLLAERNLSLDINTPVHIPGVVAQLTLLIRAVPHATFIINHMGSPPVLTTNMLAWASAMTTLGSLGAGNLYCKFGGLFQYYKNTGVFPTTTMVEPIISTVIQSFGYEKILYEGNWFFVNWYNPPRLDMLSVWTSMLNNILDTSLKPTVQERISLFWTTGVTAYRVTV